MTSDLVVFVDVHGGGDPVSERVRRPGPLRARHPSGRGRGPTTRLPATLHALRLQTQNSRLGLQAVWHWVQTIRRAGQNRRGMISFY
jgi:hypothetical protein